jgi:predicted metal-dependent hydrolase
MAPPEHAKPDYTVRVSLRARRVRLVVTPAEGLVVVVPKGFPTRRIREVVREHALWIERTLERTSERRAHLAGLADAPVPDTIDMPGIGVRWRVELRPGDAAGVRGTLHDGTLTLAGNVGDTAACRAAMRRAVGRVARERLPLMLGSAEAETGWSASKVTVRRQRSRWGSCSAKGSISLNESLVFLPQHLVRYVMVHELAHTRRMDHSPAFWALVQGHEAAWQQRRRDLRESWRHIPAWSEVPRDLA